MNRNFYIKPCLKILIALGLIFITQNVSGQDSSKLKQTTNRGVITEIVINCSREELWTLLMDFDNYESWNSYIKSVKGKQKTGKRLKITLNSGDEKDSKFRAKVLDLDENRKFSWGGKVPLFFSAKHYFTVEETEDGKVKFTQGEVWGGLLGKFYGKKWHKQSAENFLAMNQKMKELLEKE